MHPFKKAIRVLGIAESFDPGKDTRSLLAGVVMRKDLIVDGFAFSEVTVGGDDATEKVIELIKSLNRNDINIVMLSGAVISMYNILNLDRVFRKTGIPMICLTYKESKGLEDTIRKRFPQGYGRKIILYKKLGRRNGILLKTGKKVFVRTLGMGEDDVRHVMDSFALQGKFPEPVRVASLLASAIRSQGRFRTP